MGTWSPGPGATTGDDVFTGNNTAETANGLGGNDQLNGNGGNDNLSGSAGDDTLDGGDGRDTLLGGNDNDTIFDQSGTSTSIDGGSGNDRIDITFSAFSSGTVAGGTGTNVLDAGDADLSTLTITGLQTLEVGFYGGGYTVTATAAQFDAFDHIVFSTNPGFETSLVNLALSGAGTIDLSDELSSQYANVTASNLGNSITTGSGNDQLNGGTGNDTLTGAAGDDSISGNDGNDSLSGGDGDDTLDGAADNDTLSGGNDNDTIFDQSGTSTSIDGGSGNDRIDITFSAFSSGTVAGGTGTNVLDAGDADLSTLTITGLQTLEVGFYGGGYTVTATAAQFDAFDHIVFSTNPGFETSLVNLALSGAGTIDLSDELSSQYANVTASNLGNSITTGSGNDQLNGGTGNDTLTGAAGDDSISGNDGNDSLSGGDGDDTLDGAADNDTLSGGNDNDTIFDQSGTSTSIDGGSGNDRIDITFSAFSSGTVAGGTGTNVLDAGDADLSTLTITGLQTLEVGFYGGGYTVTATAAQFDAFDHIVFSTNPGFETSLVNLALSGAGTIDLSDELSSQYANVTASNLGNSITTGSGNDQLNGGTGNDTLTGAAGDDSISGNDGNDSLSGGDGDDTLDGAADNDTLSGGDDNDTIFDQSGTSTSIDGGSGNDRIDITFSAFSSGTVAGGTGTNVLDAGDADLSTLTITGLQTLEVGFYGGGYTVTATAAQFDAFDHIVFSTNPGFETSLVNLALSGAGTIDLSDELSSQYANVTASNLGNSITTGSGNDQLNGGTGNDALDGGAGVDTLNGNDGNDTLAAGPGNDTLDGGNDTDTAKFVNAFASYTITTVSAGTHYRVVGEGTDHLFNIENGLFSDGTYNFLTGVFTPFGSGVTVHGTAGNDLINSTHTPAGQPFVGSGNDTVLGNGGNDTIDGAGGSDSLVGSTGNDTYIYGAGDIITENSGEGTDTVKSDITVTLADNVEKLTLTGSGPVDGTGNGLNNTFTGNSGANTFTGLGGNDTYVLGATDHAVEDAGGGTDTVKTGATHTLEDNVEKLILTGTGSVDGTGNILANTLTGNSGDNSLSGGDGADQLDGKAGADTLVGGIGNDTYTIDALDTVSENPSEGTDTVKAGFTYTLGTDLEKLTLTGSGIIDGTGNTAANTLTGNAQANALSGLDGKDTLVGGGGDDTLHGGTGSDVLTGSAGHDAFVFDTALNASNNVDKINDFSLTDDVMQLEHTIFGSIGATLDAGEFHNGTAAADGNDFIIYDAGTGKLYYDDDGTGIHAKILFATLNNHAAISEADFTII